jgi:C4-dicarboxylate-binding protein DctP
MKKIVFFLCVLLTINSVFANGSNENDTSKKVYTIKIGHAFSAESPRNQAILAFKDYVEKKSDGRIVVKVFPAGVLGKEAEMIESMKMGNLEAYDGGPFDSLTNKLSLILMPFLFDTQDDLMVLAHSNLGQDIMDDAQKNNIKILAFGNAGSRQITNNIREIRTPADLKGIKLRTPSMKAIIESMKAFGANPVSIPYADTYMALKTGVADGEENPLANIVDMKFYEVQKYMTMINYEFHPEVLSMNLDFYNSLPADLQQICNDGAWVFADKINELRLATDSEFYQTIKQSGVQIYTPSKAEIQLFRDASAPVYESFINDGAFTREELNQARALTQN